MPSIISSLGAMDQSMDSVNHPNSATHKMAMGCRMTFLKASQSNPTRLNSVPKTEKIKVNAVLKGKQKAISPQLHMAASLIRPCMRTTVIA